MGEVSEVPAVPDPNPSVAVDVPAGGWVDSHVHLLPPRLTARVREVFAAHLPGVLAYPADPHVALDDLAAVGIGQAWVLPYAHAPNMADWLVPATAEYLAELRAERRDLELVLAGTLHPDDHDPVGLLDRAVDEYGACALKLHCAVGSFAADDPRLEPVWQRCADRQLPVVVHVGKHDSGVAVPADLSELDRVATRHPEVPLIVAHAGHPAVSATLELLRRHPGVHADLTPVVTRTPTLGDEDLCRFADRLLFGSDTPNTGHRVGQLVAFLTSRGLPDEVTAAILGGTARRLLAEVT